MAAELMQAPADALDIVDGKVVRKDQPLGPSIASRRLPTSRRPKTLGDREPACRPRAGSRAGGIRSTPTASTSPS